MCRFRVGKWTCTITFPGVERVAVKCIAIEWSPTVPRRISAGQMRLYRAGRDQALAELVGAMGGGKALITH